MSGKLVKGAKQINGLRFYKQGERPQFRGAKPLGVRARAMVAKAKAESAARRKAAEKRRVEAAAGGGKVEVKKAPKPNADGLFFYWQSRNGGKFGPRMWISESLARSLGWEG